MTESSGWGVVMRDLLEGLNDSQRAVVLHDEGPALVAAVAGSGKTRTVVHRVARLVQDGVAPSQVLCLSFSKDAATEMDVRLAALDCPARVSTFHALAYQIWREQNPTLARIYEVDSTGASYRRVIEAAMGRAGLNCANEVDLSIAEALFSRAKQGLLYPDRETVTRDSVVDLFAQYVVNPGLYADLYDETEYVLACHARGELPKPYQPVLRSIRKPFLTFDDMVGRVVFALEDDAGLREYWARRWRFVIQDEAQDQNFARVQLAELLAGGHRNYMVVGDPGQTIYTFAGARPELFLNFPHAWNAKQYLLPENYRCARRIIEVGNRALLSVAPEGRLANLQLVGQRKDDGIVQQLEGDGVYGSARAIVADIRREIAAGRRPQEIAVLCRNNAHAQAIVEILLEQRVPLQARALGHLYNRAEIKALLGYLALAHGTGTPEALADAFTRPNRYLKATLAPVVWKDWCEAAVGDATARGGYVFEHNPANPRLNGREHGAIVKLEGVLTALRRKLVEQERRVAELVTWEAELAVIEDKLSEAALKLDEQIEAASEEFFRDYAPRAVFDWLLDELDYFRFLEEKEGKESVPNTRAEAVRRLAMLQDRYEETAQFLAWTDWVRAHAAIRRTKDANLDAVTVSTVHTAKGLEWPVVYLAEVNDGVWPAPQAKTAHEREEEKRLFYVAVTRAKDRLVFAYDTDRPPSQFLSDCLKEEA